MSASRQIFSSPFDAPQQPRRASISQQNNETRRRVKDGGGHIVNSSNIMVDSRVIRLNTFHSARSNGITAKPDTQYKQHGAVLFDSRLGTGDIFANPIVTIIGENDVEQSEEKQIAASGGERIKASTPPPVKGRCHTSVQTDADAELVRNSAEDQEFKVIESSVQTILRCSFKDDPIHLDADN